MAQTHPKLSPIKEIYCINCHEELILDLAERRGEKQIICPKCKTSFSIKKAEKFMSNISPITEGQCPGCFGELIFDIEDRISKDKVKCPICGNLFFMKEVLDPSNQIIKKRKYEKRTEETTIPHSENEIPQVFIFIKDIILFLIACFILWPLAMLTLPIWGSLWLIGKIFDIDSLVEIGEVCEHILVAGGNENRPPY